MNLLAFTSVGLGSSQFIESVVYAMQCTVPKYCDCMRGVRTFHINSLVAAHFGAVLAVRFASWRERGRRDSDDIFVGLPSTNYTLQLAISVRTIPCELLIVVERGAATRVK